MIVLSALKIVSVCIDVGCWRPSNHLLFGGNYPDLQLVDDRPRNLILNGENVRKITIVPFRPKMPPCRAFDKLSRNSQAIAGPSDTSFQQILYAKFLCDPLKVFRLSAVRKACMPPDHEKARYFAEVGDDVLGNAFGKKFLLGISAQIIEWQDRNGGSPFGTGQLG